MSSGGQNSSTNNSPSASSAAIVLPTTTRRRVADCFMDPASAVPTNYNVSDNNADADEDEESDPGRNGSSSICGAGSHHSVIKYLLLRRKVVFCVPETWLLWTAAMLQFMRSGRNVGRKIFAALLLMAVISVFLKFSFLSSHVEVVDRKRTEGRLLILKTFKDDWAVAQRAVTEDQAAMPKRVLERVSFSESSALPIPELWMKPISDNFHKCMARPRNRIRTGSKTNGYLLVHANGGLNQMRTGICDMVAVAKIMNATLVLPYLDHESFWTDPSKKASSESSHLLV